MKLSVEELINSKASFVYDYLKENGHLHTIGELMEVGKGLDYNECRDISDMVNVIRRGIAILHINKFITGDYENKDIMRLDLVKNLPIFKKSELITFHCRFLNIEDIQKLIEYEIGDSSYTTDKEMLVEEYYNILRKLEEDLDESIQIKN